jgi:signal transduction histidine kinase
VTESILATARSGISCCGELQWGTHFCHLYETQNDLIETLVPFFAEGLRNNEKCLWVTSVPLVAEEATRALAQQVPNLAECLNSGQILIVDYTDWYTSTGGLDADSLLQAWITAEQDALSKGFTGLRVTGNVTFLKSRKDFHDFLQYESRVTQTFAGRRLIALCSYHVSMTNGAEVLDVVRNHQFTVARREGEWEVIESAATKLTRQELQKINSELEQRVAVRTTDLRKALDLVEAQKRELEAALRARDETQRQLETELADARMLQEISAALIDEDASDQLYQKLLTVAASLMHSRYASMQRFHREGNQLELLAHQGFSPEAVKFWKWVNAESGATCGIALRKRERVISTDVTIDPIIGADDLDIYRKIGIRAVQTTPLLSRSGALVGMISTHWDHPYQPSERELRLFDIVARQASDLIERNVAAKALREQTEQLLEADRRKDEFLATLAHELRNPLAPVLTASSLLLSSKLPQEKAAWACEIIQRQTRHMALLLDDLLDLARITQGRLELKQQQVLLSDLVEVAVETARPLLDRKNHDFDAELPAHAVSLHGDPLRLSQILSNLLTNAAKYTDAGGRIRLTATIDDEVLRIAVADNGIGLPDGAAESIFDMFSQVKEGSERSEGGLGIGLALCKGLAELHEGCIEAFSKGRRMGSEFVLSLPLTRSRSDGALPSSAPVEQAAALLRVLVVDDNQDAADTLAARIECEGHEVQVAHDGRSALALANSFRPDVAVVDIGMPGMDGHAVATALRGEAWTGDLQLIALTGWGQLEDKRRTAEAGFDQHLVKPVDFARLAELLRPQPRR